MIICCTILVALLISTTTPQVTGQTASANLLFVALEIIAIKRVLDVFDLASSYVRNQAIFRFWKLYRSGAVAWRWCATPPLQEGADSAAGHPTLDWDQLARH